MVWIGRREQVLVGLLFVLLLAVANAGRLAVAGEGVLWLANPSVGMVSVDVAPPEGPLQPTAAQVQAAMHQRIKGLELAAIQSSLERARLKQQVLVMSQQATADQARLLESEQLAESLRERLLEVQGMRENLSHELTQAQHAVQALTERLQQLEARAQVQAATAEAGQP